MSRTQPSSSAANELHPSIALGRARDRLAIVLEATGLGIHEYEVQTGRIEWDARVREIWGVGLDETITFDLFLSAIHPDDRAATRTAIDRALDFGGNGRYRAEYRVISRSDGIERHVVATGIVSFEDGRPIRLIGTVQDISDRKHLEQLAQRRASELQAIFDAAPVPIWIAHDPQCLRITGNRAADELMRAPRRANISASAPPGETAVTYRVLRNGVEIRPDQMPAQVAVANGKVTDGEELDLIFSDGRVVHLLESAVPLTDPQGHIHGAVVVGVDLTPRKRVEEALRRSEAIYRKLADANLVGVGFGDARGNVIFVNDEMLRMMGYTRADYEAGRINWMDCIAPEHREEAATSYQRLMRDGRLQYERAFIRPDGQRTPYIGAAALLEPNSDVHVSIALDLTRIRRTEQDLRAAKAALEQAAAAKDIFIAQLSHELRTPLTPVVAAISALVRDSRLPRDLQEEVQLIQRNIGLEVHLINDLLDVTRIVNGKLALTCSKTDLNEVLRDVSRIVATDLDARGQTLKLHLPDTPSFVHADASRLNQVFWNLIKNAIKFSPDGGQIDVRCALDTEVTPDLRNASDRPVSSSLHPTPQTPNPFLAISISDHGKGIDPAELPTLFRAFEQGSAERSFGGLGLGLAICRGIVELHGGTMHAQSDGRNKGATFTVRLPIAEPSATSSHPTGVSRDHAPGPAPSGLRILLVEDHADTARVMSRLLESQGHSVTRAASVAEAVFIAGNDAVDLLISDLGLPDGSGYDLMKQLVADGHRLHGIVLSGHGSPEDVRASIEAGFVEHLTKPISLDALQQALLRAQIARASR